MQRSKRTYLQSDSAALGEGGEISTARVPSSKVYSFPSRCRLARFTIVFHTKPSSSGSINKNSASPLAVWAYKRAWRTLVLLNTIKQSGGKKSGKSENIASVNAPVPLCNTSSRSFPRSADGYCAINSFGRSKSKSFVNIKPQNGRYYTRNPLPVTR